MVCILIRKNFVDENFIDSKVMMNLQNLYCMVPFSRATNFAKRKFEETIFMNLYFSVVCSPCHDRISNNFQ